VNIKEKRYSIMFHNSKLFKKNSLFVQCNAMRGNN